MLVGGFVETNLTPMSTYYRSLINAVDSPFQRISRAQYLAIMAAHAVGEGFR